MNLYFLNSPETLTKEQVGGKGFYLHQMAQDNLPIPEAAFLTTHLWQEWRKNPQKTATKIKKEIIPQIIQYFKDNHQGKMPLVSVRSAGAVSMPGMMDTILNVGVDLASQKGGKNEAFQADNRARFLSMYGNTVLGIPKEDLEMKKFSKLADVTKHFEKIYQKHKHSLPSNHPEEQLFECIWAVFNSWDNERAKLYRKLNHIDENAGTAVVIQRMVFGNKNQHSATGVMFSRNPSSGENNLTGEYLINAQGEDVVSGSATPQNMNDMTDEMPEAYEELQKIAKDLEFKYKQMQDIEFTIEDNHVFILQARTAKCAPFAKLRMLMDMYQFNEINAKDVLDRLSLKEYMDLNIKQVDPSFMEKPKGNGLPASMGAIRGRVVFGPSTKYQGDPTIFVAKETTPDDLQAIQMSDGILTATGGVTSHAAVVARGMGKVCVVGCHDLKVIQKNGNIQAFLGSEEIESGDWITIDASTGRVWLGNDVPILDAQNTKIFWDLEDVVFKANPQWTRMTSKVDELVQGQHMYFMTYALENGDDEFMENEMKDACQYLTGIMDLTGKLDYLQQKYANQFLFADISAEKNFLKKKQILIDIMYKSIEPQFDFELYLGPYEKEHAEDFQCVGFKVKSASEITLDPKNQEASLIISQYVNSSIPPQKMGISSRNALLGLLK